MVIDMIIPPHQDTAVPSADNDPPTNTPPATIPPQRKLYFINEIVEWQLTQYLWTGCTNVALRDKVMTNATELIRQIIRKQNLHTIYPGHEESSFSDLLQIAWVQIERTLYKYRSRPHCRTCFNPDRPSDSILYNPASNEYGIKTIKEVISLCHGKKCPHCGASLSDVGFVEPLQGQYGGSNTILFKGMSKVFNMWSQIARTVILAHIKKESRDRKNSSSYTTHLGSKNRPISGMTIRLIEELREMWKFHDEYIKIINAIEWLSQNDERPYEGIIGKLVTATGLSRVTITGFIHLIKLRSTELSDSNINRNNVNNKIDKRKTNNDADDEN